MVYQWPLIICKIWYMNGLIFKFFDKIDPILVKIWPKLDPLVNEWITFLHYMKIGICMGPLSNSQWHILTKTKLEYPGVIFLHDEHTPLLQCESNKQRIFIISYDKRLGWIVYYFCFCCGWLDKQVELDCDCWVMWQCLTTRKSDVAHQSREVNKNNLLSGQFLTFLLKNPGKK